MDDDNFKSITELNSTPFVCGCMSERERESARALPVLLFIGENLSKENEDVSEGRQIEDGNKSEGESCESCCITVYSIFDIFYF